MGYQAEQNRNVASPDQMARPRTAEVTDRLRDSALRAANKSRRGAPRRSPGFLRALSTIAAALILFALIVGALSIFRVRGYKSGETGEAVPHPEWELAEARDAYAKWLAAGNRPSGFPYVASTGAFWRAYIPTWSARRASDPHTIGDNVTLGVAGLATGAGYAVKGAYENTVGRLSEIAMPPGGTDEDRFSAQVARRYADLTEHQGWYSFGFWDALRDLWTTVPTSGPGPARKWERRFALSTQYGIKGAAASIPGLTSGSSGSNTRTTTEAMVGGWSDSIALSSPALSRIRATRTADSGYTVLRMPRYRGLRDAIVALSDYSGTVRIVKLSGAESVIISGTAPSGWLVPARAALLLSHEIPAERAQSRVVMRVSARDLLDVLRQLKPEGKFRLEQVYDY